MGPAGGSLGDNGAMFPLLTIFALAAPVDAPTWSRDVAPILYATCVECHRQDQAAPFPLLRY